MDILNSKILNVEGRLYINYQEEESFQHQATKDYHTDTQASFKSENSLTSLKKSIKCPSALFKYVIGSKGETRRRIEAETNSKITIPPRGQNGDISVSARSMEDIDAAITRIELILTDKRWKEPFAHFISIPLTNDSIKNGFQKFKADVISKCTNDQGITERLFQNEGKLHLTIGTLILLDEAECEKAIEVLKHIMTDNLVSSARNKNITVKGVEYMNDDPQMIDVLYAKVSCPEDRSLLQNLADYIASEFQSAGFMKKEYDSVKLHATVMNTVRTMERTEQNFKFNKGQGERRKRETFDGTTVLKTFKNYLFGEFSLGEIHISKRYSVDKSGYYESVFVGKL